jgi:hypothetical protein
LYSQLKEAFIIYSMADNGYSIIIKFFDGKQFRFSLNDENAIKAKKELLKHCSIRIVK